MAKTELTKPGISLASNKPANQPQEAVDPQCMWQFSPAKVEARHNEPEISPPVQEAETCCSQEKRKRRDL